MMRVLAIHKTVVLVLPVVLAGMPDKTRSKLCSVISCVCLHCVGMCLRFIVIFRSNSYGDRYC
jgi:hypothetical protein